ncbi:MAG: hypothetical protein AAGJ35_00135, partial [Myxococcota bacterium]
RFHHGSLYPKYNTITEHISQERALLRQSQWFQNMPTIGQSLLTYGSLYIQGLFQVRSYQPEAFKIADELEQHDLLHHKTFAKVLRIIIHSHLRNLREALREKEELAILVAQVGSGWRVECQILAFFLSYCAENGDLSGIRQIKQRYHTTMQEMPSLKKLYVLSCAIEKLLQQQPHKALHLFAECFAIPPSYPNTSEHCLAVAMYSECLRQCGETERAWNLLQKTRQELTPDVHPQTLLLHQAFVEAKILSQRNQRVEALELLARTREQFSPVMQIQRGRCWLAQAEIEHEYQAPQVAFQHLLQALLCFHNRPVPHLNQQTQSLLRNIQHQLLAVPTQRKTQILQHFLHQILDTLKKQTRASACTYVPTPQSQIDPSVLYNILSIAPPNTEHLQSTYRWLESLSPQSVPFFQSTSLDTHTLARAHNHPLSSQELSASNPAAEESISMFSTDLQPQSLLPTLELEEQWLYAHVQGKIQGALVLFHPQHQPSKTIVMLFFQCLTQLYPTSLRDTPTASHSWMKTLNPSPSREMTQLLDGFSAGA